MVAVGRGCAAAIMESPAATRAKRPPRVSALNPAGECRQEELPRSPVRAEGAERDSSEEPIGIEDREARSWASLFLGVGIFEPRPAARII